MYWLVHTFRKVDPGGFTRHVLDRRGKTFYVCSGSVRLQKNRPTPITDETFVTHRAELAALARDGVIEIRVGSLLGPLWEETPKEKTPPPAPIVEPVKPFSDEPKVPVMEAPVLEKVEEAKEDAFASTDLDSMTKNELVSFLAEKTGDSPEVLKAFNKQTLLKEAKALIA